MSFVEIDNLHVRYGKLDAVRGITFQIPRGETFGFIGPNGAGKSSTMKVLATLLKPTAGTARLGGVDIASNPRDIRRRIGYMPDFFGVYEDLTVNEYLHFFAATYRLAMGKRAAVVRDVLELVGLTHKLDAQVDSLSRGMKQRLGIARVMIHDPELLLLDEPASGLDPRARIEMRELLKELRNMGKTILISSHILPELAQFSTRIGIIEAGRLVAEGSLDDIYKRLGVNRVVHVQFAGDLNGQLAQIRLIRGVSAADLEVDRLVIKVQEDVLAVEDLLLQLQGLGLRIRMFQPEAMDMETAFMKLTEGATQ